MKELVFLLEEPSAKAFLESLLPRVLQPDICVRYIPFEGKQDLEKQLVRKIQAYQNQFARFIIVRDQDSVPDCILLKSKLLELCRQTGKEEQCTVRIACKELETFYLADLEAVEKGLSIQGLAQHQQKKKFRMPDSLGNPSQELKTLTKGRYQKISGSREIGKHLRLDNQRSPSFYHLLWAIKHAGTVLQSNCI